MAFNVLYLITAESQLTARVIPASNITASNITASYATTKRLAASASLKSRPRLNAFDLVTVITLWQQIKLNRAINSIRAFYARHS